MRVAPVSADLLVKLAVGAAVVGVLVYAVRRIGGAAGDAAAAAADWAQNTVVPALDVTADTNLAYRGVNAIGGAIASTAPPDAPGKNADGSWSLGGWLYDVTHKPAFQP